MTMQPENNYQKREAALDRINDDPAWAQRVYGHDDLCPRDQLVSPPNSEQSNTYQDRVLAEKSELDGRLAKLVAFIDGDVFAALPDDERLRMRRQVGVMGEYSEILRQRIQAWE